MDPIFTFSGLVSTLLDIIALTAIYGVISYFLTRYQISMKGFVRYFTYDPERFGVVKTESFKGLLHKYSEQGATLNGALQHIEELREELDERYITQTISTDMLINIFCDLPDIDSDEYKSLKDPIIVCESDLLLDFIKGDIAITNPVEVMIAKDETASHGWKVLTPILVKHEN